MDDFNYYNDHRVRAGERGSWFSSFDESTMTATKELSLNLTPEQAKSLKLPPIFEYVFEANAVHTASRFGCRPAEDGEFEEIESGLAASSDTVLQIIATIESYIDGDAETGFLYEDVELQIRCTFEVCPTCDGKGKHVNPSIDAGGISSGDEFWDDDWDYDGAEGGQSRYMRGDYDVPCYECHSKRVVPVPSSDNPDFILKALQEWDLDQAAYEAERAAERRMGA